MLATAYGIRSTRRISEGDRTGAYADVRRAIAVDPDYAKLVAVIEAANSGEANNSNDRIRHHMLAAIPGRPRRAAFRLGPRRRTSSRTLKNIFGAVERSSRE